MGGRDGTGPGRGRGRCVYAAGKKAKVVVSEVWATEAICELVFVTGPWPRRNALSIPGFLCYLYDYVFWWMSNQVFGARP